MSLFNSILTQQQKGLLIVGYIRFSYNENHRYYPNDPIPNGLIKLCFEFLDLSIKWNIAGNELKQFLSARNGEAIAGPSFIIQNVKFNLYLTPNGINASEEGYVQFLAGPIFTECNINNVTFWYSLYCNSTNSEWNNTTIFYCDDNDCASWPVHTLPLSQITSKFIKKSNHEKGSNIFDNKFECDFIVNSDDKLEFLCYIDIINVEYNDDIISSYFGSTHIFMNKYAKFQWNIYNELLQDFRYCVWGKYYFQNINVNWMLECAPNGQSSEDEGNVNVLLSLLRLPNKIKSVLIHITLNCDYNDIKWDFKLKYDYDSNSYGWPEYTLLSSYLLSTTSITFTLQINILQIYDKNNRKIPQYKWKEYGIIDNKNELKKEFDLEFKQRHKEKLQLQQKMVLLQSKHIIKEHININTGKQINGLIKEITNNDNNNNCNQHKNKKSSLCSKKKQGLNNIELLVELLMAVSHGLPPSHS